MRATGIVRRLDDLGRVVVPKEIRKSLGIKEGDSLGVELKDDKTIHLRKVSVDDTWLIRYIDELGRVQIPKEMRKFLNWKEGEATEFFIDGESIVLKYYEDGSDLSQETSEPVNSINLQFTEIKITQESENELACAHEGEYTSNICTGKVSGDTALIGGYIFKNNGLEVRLNDGIYSLWLSEQTIKRYVLGTEDKEPKEMSFE